MFQFPRASKKHQFSSKTIKAKSNSTFKSWKCCFYADFVGDCILTRGLTESVLFAPKPRAEGSSPSALQKTRNIHVPRLFYARILLFMAIFGQFFFALKYRESFWEILRDGKFQNSKVILVRFRAFMTETFERHRSNRNRNTN